ncbi:hypothetical protein PHYSODRAFT_340972 [Phytophthora sojae]|uniref:Uncharacterized protein n=1 Tax=Phytophthora sojae (strain P6497) TaxID=1094619 RepID=G5ABQ6_PHYSP|nr:hypothetical protein PHYSODRAFT_340972 [Phytophthora sojae]EGZ06781.1 hypothetical protein PHYSODRAFT_340972 [Phytophthora sojae]|eukprot:XP_009537545.1 hypothetical protein PHYSODRAFT_340972 [Phytophthora sojae]
MLANMALENASLPALLNAWRTLRRHGVQVRLHRDAERNSQPGGALVTIFSFQYLNGCSVQRHVLSVVTEPCGSVPIVVSDYSSSTNNTSSNNNLGHEARSEVYAFIAAASLPR